MGKINVVDMMNMPLCVQFHILGTLGSTKDKAWEYNPDNRILIVDLHKLFIPIGYDDEEHMSNIFVHIHLWVVDHVIIHVYVKFYIQYGYNGHSMTLYHPIDIRCFPKLYDLVCNPFLKVFVNYRLHGNVDDTKE
jgi:hypothetical protein